MNPIQSSETIRIIHDDMVRRELRRNSPDGYRFTRGGVAPAGLIAGLRRVAGRMLIRTGAMITRAPEPGTVEPTTPVVHMAAYRQGDRRPKGRTGDGDIRKPDRAA